MVGKYGGRLRSVPKEASVFPASASQVQPIFKNNGRGFARVHLRVSQRIRFEGMMPFERLDHETMMRTRWKEILGYSDSRCSGVRFFYPGDRTRFVPWGDSQYESTSVIFECDDRIPLRLGRDERNQIVLLDAKDGVKPSHACLSRTDKTLDLKVLAGPNMKRVDLLNASLEIREATLRIDKLGARKPNMQWQPVGVRFHILGVTDEEIEVGVSLSIFSPPLILKPSQDLSGPALVIFPDRGHKDHTAKPRFFRLASPNLEPISKMDLFAFSKLNKAESLGLDHHLQETTEREIRLG